MSMGEYDLVPKVLASMGASIRIANLETISTARKAGADYYLTIPFTIVQCLTAVRFTVGQSGAGKGDTSAVGQPFAGGGPEDSRLTKRENEVMRGFEKGMLYKEVADELGISRSTVHIAPKNGLRKLRQPIDDVVDAVREGVDVGRLDGREHADPQLIAA